MSVSLFEILITLMLLATMLLGFDVMQVNALRQQKAIYYYHVASQQLLAFAEHISVLKAHHISSDVLQSWNMQNKEALPQGFGMLEQVGTDLNITIFWGHHKTYTCRQNVFGLSGCMRFKLPTS